MLTMRFIQWPSWTTSVATRQSLNTDRKVKAVVAALEAAHADGSANQETTYSQLIWRLACSVGEARTMRSMSHPYPTWLAPDETQRKSSGQYSTTSFVSQSSISTNSKVSISIQFPKKDILIQHSNSQIVFILRFLFNLWSSTCHRPCHSTSNHLWP